MGNHVYFCFSYLNGFPKTAPLLRSKDPADGDTGVPYGTTCMFTHVKTIPDLIINIVSDLRLSKIVSVHLYALRLLQMYFKSLITAGK